MNFYRKGFRRKSWHRKDIQSTKIVCPIFCCSHEYMFLYNTFLYKARFFRNKYANQNLITHCRDLLIIDEGCGRKQCYVMKMSFWVKCVFTFAKNKMFPFVFYSIREYLSTLHNLFYETKHTVPRKILLCRKYWVFFRRLCVWEQSNKT